jgi:hypothetical protein
MRGFRARFTLRAMPAQTLCEPHVVTDNMPLQA